MSGFGFNLDGPNITMWVGEAESDPLTDLQLEECIRTIRDFQGLRARRDIDTKSRWRQDLSQAVVLAGDD